MPRVVPGENRQAQAAGVDLADDLVSIRVAHGSRFTGEVHYHERRKTHGFAGVGLCRGNLTRHWRPLLRTRIVRRHHGACGCRSYVHLQVAAPSSLRTRAPSSKAGSKLVALTATG